jgi:RNA polymerase subunit RPABC4/transcription elongation factor Spt4
MDILKYNTIDIEAHMRSLWGEFEAGMISSRDYWALQPTFIFRDDRSAYWYYDPSSTNWYRHLDGVWQAGIMESVQLEGLEGAIPIRLFRVDEMEQFIKVRELDPEPADLSPLEALVDLSEETKKAYEQGLITSSDVKELISLQCIMDVKGGIWAFGIRSNQWFYFEDGKWWGADRPPRPDTLLKAEDIANICPKCNTIFVEGDICPNCRSGVTKKLGKVGALADKRLLEFANLAEHYFPEDITDPWDPPTEFLGLPEPALISQLDEASSDESRVPCASCGAMNPATSLFCNQCGTKLGCPNCGTINRPESKFCRQCGSSLST